MTPNLPYFQSAGLNVVWQATSANLALQVAEVPRLLYYLDLALSSWIAMYNFPCEHRRIDELSLRNHLSRLTTIVCENYIDLQIRITPEPNTGRCFHLLERRLSSDRDWQNMV